MKKTKHPVSGQKKRPALMPAIALSIIAPTALGADGTLTFKTASISTSHWYLYLVVIGVLFLTLLFLAKKSKGLVKPTSEGRLIEKIPLHHKAQVYIIEYQNQRFLIADNQNALAIHPMHEDKNFL